MLPATFLESTGQQVELPSPADCPAREGRIVVMCGCVSSQVTVSHCA
jgi:hypothetical protein